ncbi:glycosyltransferase family 4 protein [Marispirochaeta sp.]|uniref:glycosyltransferase family 4 protein n=1 Tax=Marispirochaeta sp. TaxID=2038653 RepID=UPI0029C7E250|nr:glycosyltransferase family 4 protein [Marispirochaeta sp.]
MDKAHIVISYNGCWYVWNTRRPLIRALQDAGYRLSVVAPRDDYTEKLTGMGLGYREIELDAKGINPIRDLKTLARYKRVYRELSPSILLQYTIKPNIYGSIAAKGLGIPVINNITGLGTVFERPGPLQTAVRMLYRYAFSRAEKIFFQNPDDRRLFLDGKLIHENQTGLLPGSGVNPDYFSPRPRPEGPFCFLFVGRLLKAKGVEDFIAAAEIVKTRHPEIRFVLVGPYDSSDPWSADKNLLQSARDRDIIEVPGPTDEIRDALAAADCMVLPSRYREGIPRSLLEAASMAKPLIAADSVGTREPVRDGVNGYLCRPGEPGDLAAKMEQMLALSADELKAMGKASRALVKECFDEEIVINTYLQTVDDILKDGS